MLYHSVVSSVIFYAVVYWGSRQTTADNNGHNKLIRRVGSVLGVELESVVEVSEKRMLRKLFSIIDNVSHSLHATLTSCQSSFHRGAPLNAIGECISKLSSEQDEKMVSPAPSTSPVSETTSKIVSETLDRVATNIEHQDTTTAPSGLNGHLSTVSGQKTDATKKRHGSKTYKKLNEDITTTAQAHGPSRVLPGAEDECETVLVNTDAKYNLDETAESQGSHLKSGSPCTDKTLPTASMCSSGGTTNASKADLSLSFDPQLTDEEIISLVLPRTEGRGSTTYKKIMATCKSSFKRKPKKKVTPVATSNLDETAEPEGSHLKSGSDIKKDSRADLSSNPVELINKSITPETKKETSSAEVSEAQYAVIEEDVASNLSFDTLELTNEKITSLVLPRTEGRGSTTYKKITGTWKSSFKWKPKKKVTPVATSNLDETAEPEGSHLKSGSDIKKDSRADLSSNPVELINKNITPETKKETSSAEVSEAPYAVIEEDVASNLSFDTLELTDEKITSLVLPRTEGRGSTTYKKITGTWKSSFKWKPKKKVTPVATSNLDETAEPEGSHLKSGSDIKKDSRADLSSNPVELINKSITPETKKETSSAEVSEAQYAVIEEDVASNLSFDTLELTNEKITSLVLPRTEGRGSRIYKKITGTWKSSFKWKPKKKVTPVATSNLDETAEPEGSHLKSGSDIKKDSRADLSSNPVELINKSITPETKKETSSAEVSEAQYAVIEEDVTSNLSFDTLELTNEKITSLVLPRTEGECKTVLTVSQQSSYSDKKGKKPVGRGSTIYKKIKAAWKCNFKCRRKNKVTPVATSNLDETAEPEGSHLKSGSPYTDKASPTPSMCSSEHNGNASKADLCSETVKFIDRKITPETKKDPSPVEICEERSAVMEEDTVSNLTIDTLELTDEEITQETKEDQSSAEISKEWPAVVIKHSSVTDRDQTMYKDSTSGPSGEERNIDHSPVVQITGLKDTFFNIIKEFFDSLTEEQRIEMSTDIYNADVKEKLADMCVKVLHLVIETIADIMSAATHQSAPPYRRTETVGQKLLSELLKEDSISQSLKGSLRQAICDVVDADTSIDISPTFTEAILKAVTYVLSETIQARLEGKSLHAGTVNSKCRACKEMLPKMKRLVDNFLTSLSIARKRTDQTVKVHRKKSPWWSCLCKGKKTSLETGYIPVCPITWFPPDCLEDDVPNYQGSFYKI
ncbi:hypothetical protein L3Q82_004970 [Scortum barcoo]|uniref:Uncharacterized protein n=1 Tax=Scortum barcoo TaxID=214431 RepID=A0ACB8VFR1_9TELE|nr:hypothetical protein L3Q82_004970 [Scortum barcoo]